MSEICPVCGLPKELCVCNNIGKEDQEITVRVEKKKFGKLVTIIEGLDPKTVDVHDILKQLKKKLACGGTAKESTIELQGDHRSVIKKILVDLGFSETSIRVKH